MPGTMSAQTTGWKIAWLLVLVVPCAFSERGECAGEETIRQEIRNADAELNANYQVLLHALPERKGEQLRLAERAWLAFIAKNDEAISALSRQRSESAAAVLQLRLAEIRYRTEELRAMEGRQPTSSGPVPAGPQQLDEELNQIYQKCLPGLSATDERRLRDAQRAWIDFRDRQGRADSTKRYQSAATSTCLVMIHRIALLKAIYLGAAVAEEKADLADPSIPDPFATAR